MGCGGSTDASPNESNIQTKICQSPVPEETKKTQEHKHDCQTTLCHDSTDHTLKSNDQSSSRGVSGITGRRFSRMSTMENKVAKVSESSVIAGFSSKTAHHEGSSTGPEVEDDEFIPDIDNWENQKPLTEPEYEQVNIPEQLSDYPPAAPPPNKSADVIKVEDIMVADFAARKVKVEAFESMKDLVSSLTDHLVNDVSKARAIFMWIGIQRINSLRYPESTTSGTPLDFLKLLSLQQMSYASMFTMMCREANLRCIVIRGVAKSTAYQVGDKRVDGLRNAWCAVFVAGGWRLVFPLWGLSVIEGRRCLLQKKGGYGSNDLLVTSSSDSVDEYYFLTEPRELAYVCFPDNKKWQLLKKPMSKEMFISVPYLRPEYFIHNLKITTKFESILTTENGQCCVGLKPLYSRQPMDLTYEFLFNHSESKQDVPPDIKLHRYVAILNLNNNETLFSMRFPVSGVYQFRVLDGEHARVCFFKILCTEPMAICCPYPMSSVFGYGPCRETLDAGLNSASHLKGLIHIKRGRDLIIRFKMTKVLNVQATLVHNEIPCDQLQKHISQRLDHDTVTFTITLSNNGEYGFQIYCKEYSSLEPYRNVCNYLLIVANPRRKQRKWENAEEKITRRKFLDILDTSNDPKLIRSSMEKFLELGLKDDEAVQRAQDRVEYLTLAHGINEAILSRNLEKLELAVEATSESKHIEILRHKIEEAKDLIEYLQKLRRFAHDVLEMKQTTVSEIHRYIIPKPIVFDIMKATFFLLGEQLKHIEYWEYIQVLMRQQGDRSLINRIRRFDTIGMEVNTARTALEWLAPYDKSTATSVSCATGAFYVWAFNIGQHFVGKENSQT